MKFKLTANKKGDMPFYMSRVILALIALVVILLIVLALKKGIYSSILDIFKRW